MIINLTLFYLAPDVTVISNQLRVERVNLQSAEVAISFPVRSPLLLGTRSSINNY